MTQAPTPGPLSASGRLPKTLGQQAYEKMRDHNDNACRGMNDHTAWESLTPGEQNVWEKDANSRPHLYGLAPTAPVEASGSEDLAGKLAAIRDKFLIPTPDKDFTDYAILTRCIEALRPQPSGSEREEVASWRSELEIHATNVAARADRWRRSSEPGASYWTEQDDAEVAKTKARLAILATLRPQPSGETREAVARIIDPSAWVFFDNAMRPFLENRGAENDEAWIYDVTYGTFGMRSPEQVRTWLIQGKPRLGVTGRDHTTLQASLAKADRILALIRPTPVALGGQHSSGEVEKWIKRALIYIEQCVQAAEIHFPGVEEDPADLAVQGFALFGLEGECDPAAIPNAKLLSTTPARAEALDEGAAGELKPCPFHHSGKSPVSVKQSGKFTFYVECYGGCRGPKETSEKAAIREWNYRAHPSPTPAADADRVRIAVEALEPFANLGVTSGPDDEHCHYAYRIRRGAIRNARLALAALKSTAAKEGGEG